MRVGLLALAATAGLPSAAVLASSDGSRALTEISDISGLSVSPDGRRLIFRVDQGDAASNSYRLTWHMLDTSSGVVRDLGSGGAPVYDDPGLLRTEKPLWSPDSRRAFVRILDPNGAIGLWEVGEPDGMRPVAILPGNIEGAELGSGGQALRLTVGPDRAAIVRAEQQEYDAGVRIDETVDLPQALVHGGSIDGRMATQRMKGFWTVRGGLLWQAPRQTYRLDLRSGELQASGPPQSVPPFTPPSPLLSSTSSSGWQVNAEWSDGRGRVNAKSGRRTIACTASLCLQQRVAWLRWRPGHAEAILAFQDEHLGMTLAAWAPSTGRVRILHRSGGILTGSRRRSDPCAVGREQVYCVAASAAGPPRLIRIDLTNRNVTTIFDPNGRAFASYHPVLTPLSIPSPGGGIVTGVLLTPPGPPQRRPLFLNYYRCEGFLRGGQGDEWPLPDLLHSGIAVVCLNAAPQRGPQNALVTYEAALNAITALVGQLDRAGIIDRSRIAMGGFSFGSEVALWTAGHSDLLRAISIASSQWEPSSYWSAALLGAKHRQTTEQVWGLGDPDRTPIAWDRMSPARYAGRIRAATLFQLPEQEARQIPELVVRLRDAGTPVEFYGFPDEDHLKVQPRHRLSAYQRNLDWLRFWLQDHVDPDPGKAADYQRWQAMRDRQAQRLSSSERTQP